MAPNSPNDTKAVAQVLKPIYDAIREMEAFKNRGLSHRTIKALVDCGIDARERVLFTRETLTCDGSPASRRDRFNTIPR
jgi:hypothetical protein